MGAQLRMRRREAAVNGCTVLNEFNEERVSERIKDGLGEQWLPCLDVLVPHADQNMEIVENLSLLLNKCFLQ